MNNSEEAKIIVFDGVCNLCNSFVQFVIRHDPRGVFKFASRQSPAGRSLLGAHAVDDPSIPDTVVVIVGNRVFYRSDAVLVILKSLAFPWPIFTVGKMLPRKLRDILYDFVAAHRYRWFGQAPECWVPTPELRARFL